MVYQGLINRAPPFFLDVSSVHSLGLEKSKNDLPRQESFCKPGLKAYVKVEKNVEKFMRHGCVSVMLPSLIDFLMVLGGLKSPHREVEHLW